MFKTPRGTFTSWASRSLTVLVKKNYIITNNINTYIFKTKEKNTENVIYFIRQFKSSLKYVLIVIKTACRWGNNVVRDVKRSLANTLLQSITAMNNDRQFRHEI